jgi:hypothetical protein
VNLIHMMPNIDLPERSVRNFLLPARGISLRFQLHRGLIGGENPGSSLSFVVFEDWSRCTSIYLDLPDSFLIQYSGSRIPAPGEP